ncbi:MAG: hypothetical protein LKJ69_06780 [Lactobacillus sp.]|nr:hypothetical protein [Lactobacillus sp.]MCI2033094.1 hypothetical protein [Lactobacillus sp.]
MLKVLIAMWLLWQPTPVQAAGDLELNVDALRDHETQQQPASTTDHGLGNLFLGTRTKAQADQAQSRKQQVQGAQAALFGKPNAKKQSPTKALAAMNFTQPVAAHDNKDQPQAATKKIAGWVLGLAMVPFAVGMTVLGVWFGRRHARWFAQKNAE